MKRFFTGLFLVVLLAGCTFYFTDKDGFRISDNTDLPAGCYVIQSHDHFKIGAHIYQEEMRDPPITIENVLPREISVRIWHEGKTQWVKIPALGSLNIGEKK